MKTVWLHSLNHQEKPAAIKKKHHELDKPTLACLLSRRMFFFFSLSKIRFLLFWLDHFSREKYSTGLNLTDEAKNLRQELDPGLTLGPTGMAINRIRNANGVAPHSWLSLLHTEAGGFAAVQSSAVNFIHGYQPRQDMEERKPPRRLLCSESFIAFQRRLQSIFSDLSQTSIPLALLNLQYTSLKVIMPPSSLKCQHTHVIRFC